MASEPSIDEMYEAGSGEVLAEPESSLKKETKVVDEPLTSVPLTELQCYRLQATEVTLQLRKIQVCSEIDKKYAVARALELDKAMRENEAVKAAHFSSNKAVNTTLTELEALLPERYSPTNLEWETGTAHVAHVPEARGRRLPVE